jgi:hypothetical protein
LISFNIFKKLNYSKKYLIIEIKDNNNGMDNLSAKCEMLNAQAIERRLELFDARTDP